MMDGWESGLPVLTLTRVKARPSQSRRGDAFQGFGYARVKTAAGFFT